MPENPFLCLDVHIACCERGIAKLSSEASYMFHIAVLQTSFGYLSSLIVSDTVYKWHMPVASQGRGLQKIEAHTIMNYDS